MTAPTPSGNSSRGQGRGDQGGDALASRGEITNGAMHHHIRAEATADAILTGADYRPGRLRHIVLFQYKETTTPAQRQEIEDRFHALVESRRQGKPYIVSIESGPQSSPEGLHRGLDHGFIVTFRSEGDRNYYLGEPLISDPSFYDPAHHQFKKFIGPHLHSGGVLVFDFAPDRRGES